MHGIALSILMNKTEREVSGYICDKRDIKHLRESKVENNENSVFYNEKDKKYKVSNFWYNIEDLT